MSITSWKNEFYKVSASAEATLKSDQAALQHCLVKWTGALPDNLSKHEVEFEELTETVEKCDPGHGKAGLLFGKAGCAMCHLHERCDTCALYVDGLRCVNRSDPNKPETVIKIIKEALKNVKKVPKEDSK